MGKLGDLSGSRMTAMPAAEFAGAGAHSHPMRMVPDIPVIDPWSGQNFQEYGPHTAYFRWLVRQPGDLSRYRPADYHPLIAEARFAHYRLAKHPTSSARRGESRNVRSHIDALTLGLCCGWRALDQIQARWLHAWLNSMLASTGGLKAEGWKGSHAEQSLARYCRESGRQNYNPAVQTAFQRISAAGMTAVFEDACRFESWRDVEMLLMSAWQSGISLVDGEGCLLQGWKPRFALAFAMRFPEIS